jgi:S-adenosyl methyltransferase
MSQAVPNIARMYDYYLGGQESHPVDREAAERPSGCSRSRPMFGLLCGRTGDSWSEP